MSAVSRETTTRRPRRQAANRAATAPSPARRTRAPREPLDRVLAELDRMISALIKENRDLKREVERASRQGIATSSGTADRLLRSIQRRISRAGEGGRTAGRQRSAAAAAPASRTRRKITDPEVLERRRQALAKARAARAAKRASGS
jgi:hypothetical protein